MNRFLTLKICVVGILFSLLWRPACAHAGAWVQSPGGFFLSLQTYYYETNRYFTQGGHTRKRGGIFRKWEINPYLEYGLTDRDTLVCNLFYDWLSDDASGTKRSTEGFTDIEVSWRRLLARRDPHIFSVQGTVILPTGYDLDDDPRLGYARPGMEASLLYGRYFKWGPRYGFLDVSLGYRYYFGYPGSQIRTLVTTGYDVFPRLQILVMGETHLGLNDGREKSVGPNLIVQPDYRLLKLTLAARWRISKHYSLVFAGYRHVWGENSGGDGGFYVSLWIHR